MMIRKLLFLAALLWGTAARAEWHEATSANFLVYSQGSESEAREFAAKLERFHYVLRFYYRLQAPPAPNRLRVFLLPNIDAVGRMAGGDGVAGYYVDDARGLMMVGTRRGISRGQDIRTAGQEATIDPESVLLHEYAHHFMRQYFPATYPTWYSEGFAEFWGTTRFLPNNVVEVGRPANFRYASLIMNRWLPVGRLLSAQSYADVPEVDLLYVEGWLLVRYAFENAERRAQLQRYLTLINGGRSYADAAREAFGDLGRLNSELITYGGRQRVNVLQLPFRELPTGEIAVRRLRPAEEALIEFEIRLSQGAVSAREIADFARDVRAVAARFPDDPMSVALLTEVEYLAGNAAEAGVAAERWAAVAPNDGRALMYQGMLQVAALRAARSADTAAWNAARRLFVRANQLTPNNPLILNAYYESYAAQGTLPPEPAQNALYTAMELAPGDEELRYRVALDFERRDMIADAIAIIRPLAYRLPAPGSESARERREREARERRELRAGREHHESPRDMLARLEARPAEASPAPASSPQPR